MAFDFHLPQSNDRGMNQAGLFGAGRIRQVEGAQGHGIWTFYGFGGEAEGIREHA
ncbi:UNVERIFIED_CONTAM: hypothetical protein GTU68_028809 [Idotea baltica]|nr:hypothetical protein [Idotea baltica]